MRLKLHAVAPGGPPEGQCKEAQEMVCSAVLTAPSRITKARSQSRVGSLVVGSLFFLTTLIDHDMTASPIDSQTDTQWM